MWPFNRNLMKTVTYNATKYFFFAETETGVLLLTLQ